MEHQALYRKYRPRVFDDVYGQDHITSVLKYEAEHGLLSHAYLFCGPRGTGKTTCAKILAKVVNCDEPVNGSPCGKCYKCKSIDDGSATDVVEMDAASNTGVEYIRDIRDEVTYSPAVMKKRVYIIDEVHMLSIGAFNALLKTLEEPPEHVMFILATTEQHKLPATIVSRCQRFDFRRITAADIAARLEYIASAESIELEHDAALLLARQAQGGMRDAVNLFELCAGGGNGVTVDRVREALGISGIENAYRTALAVKSADHAILFRVISDVVSSSKDIAVFWQELISFWRDMLVVKSVRESDSYLDMTAADLEMINSAAARFTASELIYHSTLLDEAMLTMNRIPQIKRNTAELTLIKMSDPALGTSPDALSARISLIGDKIKLMNKSAVQAVQISHEAETMTESVKQQRDEKGSSDHYSRKDDSSEEDNSGSSVSVKIQSSDGFREIPDKSELLEKIGSMNPILRGFVGKAACFVSDNGREILIKTPNEFSASMLRSEDSVMTLRDAFALCSLADGGASIKVEVSEIADQTSPMNELDGI